MIDFQDVLNRHGVTVERLISLGFSQHTLTAYCLGNRTVGLDAAKRLQERAGIPIWEFFPGMTYRPPQKASGAEKTT